ncbi:MAG: hypothetical protein ACREUQ_02405 [Burkholderiales bacterium]
MTIALLAASTASAETTLSLSLGQSSTRDSALKIEQPSTSSAATFEGVSWKDRSYEAPIYYAIRLAHYFESSPQWGLSLDFVHYKVYAQTEKSVKVSGTWNGFAVNEDAPLDQRVQGFSISHGVNFLGVSVLHRWLVDRTTRFPNGKWQPYLGGGPVLYVLHPENTINGLTADEKYQTSGFGFQVFTGVTYRLTAHWSLTAESRYDKGEARVDIAGGTAETDLQSFHLTFGIGYSF